MDLNIKLIATAFIVVLFLLVTSFVKRGKMTVKYSVVWYLCLLTLLVFTIIPNLLGWFTKLIGIQVSSNFIFAFMIGVLFVISISLTVYASEQNEKIRTLIQEVSILKEEKNEQNKRK